VTAVARPRHSIRFRGRTFHAMVLAPEPPLADWFVELDAWLQRSPGFFAGRPIVLDFSALQPTRSEAEALLAELQKRDVRIMGVQGADPSWHDGDMPPLLTSGRQGSVIEIVHNVDQPAPVPTPAPSPTPAPAPAVPEQPNSLLIESSLRSGQSIDHPEGDVIIVGSVASGAEVIAGGSIHIYGALRGRAIAGASGARGRIFCRKFEAELLAIDGLYMTADYLDPALRGKPVQVWLDGDTMMMAALD